MMYRIIKDDGIIATEKLIFVKKQRNGKIVVCPENEAMGIVTEIDDGFYNIANKGGLGDYQAVSVEKIDITEELAKKIDENFLILFEAAAEIFETMEIEE